MNILAWTVVSDGSGWALFFFFLNPNLFPQNLPLFPWLLFHVSCDRTAHGRSWPWCHRPPEAAATRPTLPASDPTSRTRRPLSEAGSASWPSFATRSSNFSGLRSAPLPSGQVWHCSGPGPQPPPRLFRWCSIHLYRPSSTFLWSSHTSPFAHFHRPSFSSPAPFSYSRHLILSATYTDFPSFSLTL